MILSALPQLIHRKAGSLALLSLALGLGISTFSATADKVKTSTAQTTANVVTNLHQAVGSVAHPPNKHEPRIRTYGTPLPAIYGLTAAAALLGWGASPISRRSKS